MIILCRKKASADMARWKQSRKENDMLRFWMKTEVNIRVLFCPPQFRRRKLSDGGAGKLRRSDSGRSISG